MEREQEQREQESNKDPLETVKNYYHQEFGVRKSFFGGKTAIEKKSGYWVFSSTVRTPPMFESTGIPALRRLPKGYKPTTYFLVLLDKEIKRKRVELSREELLELLSRGEIDKPTGEHGFVALSLEGRIVGCGHAKENLLRSMIPRARASELLESISRA